MDSQNKLRVITDYEKLSEEIQEQIKLEYPRGYSRHLITFKNREGKNIKGLRFESEEKIYLIRMTIIQAEEIINDDDDFNDDGNLIKSIKDKYEDKYSDDLDDLEDLNYLEDLDE